MSLCGARKLVPLDAFQEDVRNVCGNFVVSPHDGARDMRGSITPVERPTRSKWIWLPAPSPRSAISEARP